MSTGRLGAGDTAIQPTIFDAKGDLIVATAADTPARLAVGSANQVLTVDSSTATGLKWATPSTDTNGYVYITGSTFSSVSSFSLPTNTFTSTYKNYKIFVWFSGYTTDSALLIRMRQNGTDFTSSNYFYGTAKQPYNTSYTSTSNSAVSAWQIGLGSYYERCAFELTYIDPKGSGDKAFVTGMADLMAGMFGGLYQNGTSNVDSLTFSKASGNMSGSYRVYGLADA